MLKRSMLIGAIIGATLVDVGYITSQPISREKQPLSVLTVASRCSGLEKTKDQDIFPIDTGKCATDFLLNSVISCKPEKFLVHFYNHSDEITIPIGNDITGIYDCLAPNQKIELGLRPV